MDDFYSYLMLEMPQEINSQWPEKSHRAHELCFLLSIDGHPVPESFFKLYASAIDAEALFVNNALAYFSGASLLKVECDCTPEWKASCTIGNIHESDFYQVGIDSRAKGDEVYSVLAERINDVREAFDAVEPIDEAL
jgi:hypothetical protein